LTWSSAPACAPRRRGLPDGLKWELTRKSAGDTKFVLCNGDEGTRARFMDRSLLEGDPQA